MKTRADLTRRLAVLEGAQRGRMVVLCCGRSRADLPVYGMRGAGVRSADYWQRKPGESLESLHARASAEIGDGRFGYFTLYEVGSDAIEPRNWQGNA